MSGAESSEYRIEIDGTGRSYICRPGESLLKGMEISDEDPIAVGCRGGGCGVCKIHITEGEFSAKAMSKAHISEAERARGVVLACRVFPTSDLKFTVCNSTD